MSGIPSVYKRHFHTHTHTQTHTRMRTHRLSAFKGAQSRLGKEEKERIEEDRRGEREKFS